MYFGDVPQHVLFDNAGIIVIERDAVAKASIAGMVKCWRSPMRMASPGLPLDVDAANAYVEP